MKVFLILLAIYVAQILIVLAYPYYKYRKDCLTKRTIGGFMNFMERHNIGGLKLCAFFPFMGLVSLVIVCIICFIGSFFTWVYENLIKNIKI